MYAASPSESGYPDTTHAQSQASLRDSEGDAAYIYVMLIFSCTFFLSAFLFFFKKNAKAVAVGTTSALSHALIGQAKTASMLLLSPIIYGEATTTRQLLGGASAMVTSFVIVIVFIFFNFIFRPVFTSRLYLLADSSSERKNGDATAVN